MVLMMTKTKLNRRDIFWDLDTNACVEKWKANTKYVYLYSGRDVIHNSIKEH